MCYGEALLALKYTILVKRKVDGKGAVFTGSQITFG